MAVNQITLSQIQNEFLAIYSMIDQQLRGRIMTFANSVIAIGTAGLQAAPYSLSSGDATDCFNAAQDYLNFCKVWQGLGYVTLGATLNTGTYHDNNGSNAFGYPFSTNPKKVAGLGY